MSEYLTINLILDIEHEQIKFWLEENPGKTLQDFLNEMNNLVYLGGDCINAMVHRKMEIDIDHYIKKEEKLNQLKNLLRFVEFR
jgi:hypothetical protein